MANIQNSLALATAAAILTLRCQAVQPTLGSEVRNIEIKAVTAPSRTLTLASPVDGKVVRIAVRQGDSIADGGTVITLSNPAIERDYELARAQRSLAESNLFTTETPMASSFNLASTRAVTGALELVLENKRAKLQRYRELRRRNDVSEQELEDAENEYAWAQRDYLSQQRSPVLLANNSNRRVLEVELAKARAEEKAARERIRSLTITSPLAGTVTSIRAIEGQFLYARDAVADITDLSTMEVRGEVPADLINFVHPGMQVEVKVFTVPARTVRATIDHVVPAPADGASPEVVVMLANEKNVFRPKTPAKITVLF